MKADWYLEECGKLIRQALKLQPNKAHLAKDLKVSRAIVHMWANGAYAMRPGNFAAVKNWVEAKKQEKRKVS